MKKEDHDLNLYRYDGTNIPFHKYAVESLRKSDYIQSVYKQRIVENRPSEIIVGGSLQADGGNWLNKDSFILSGGTAFINNEPSKQTVRTVNDGFSRRGSYDKHGSRGSRHIEFDKDVIPVSAIPPASADFEVPVSEVRQNTAALSFAGQPQAAAVSTAAVSPEGSTKVLVRSLPQASALPSGSLFTVDSARPDYLVETDPAFTDRRQWLGSSYMLKALGPDTANTQKRLGDGYYEQRLVTEQIARLTGYRRLEGYAGDETQFKALMDAGITAAKQLGLTPGIALTAEQTARLASDIVWLEPQTHILIDGSRVTVLAPKVYLLARTGDVDAAGGLVSAENIRLVSDGLTNSGTVAGRRIVDLNAQNISNSGLISGGKVALEADRTTFDSGRAEAQNRLSLKGGSVRIGSTVSETGDARNGGSITDRTAGLYVNNRLEGLLLVEAGKIDFVGATLRNRAAGGQTIIRSEGDISLGTVETAKRESHGSESDKNHRIVRQQA